MYMAVPKMRLHVSSPCDRGKHTYFDNDGAIYLLHKVCLIMCTLEFMSSGRGDDVLLQCLLSHVTMEKEGASVGPDC